MFEVGNVASEKPKRGSLLCKGKRSMKHRRHFRLIASGPVLSALILAVMEAEAIGATVREATQLVLVHPRCEGMAEAIGVRESQPRFTWGLEGLPDSTAAESEIRVIGVGGRDLWSGQGDDLFSATYRGPALAAGTIYRWQARLVDRSKKGVTAWTPPQTLVLALLDEKAWGRARWIREDRDFAPRLGDGKLVVTFKSVAGRLVVGVRCRADGTGGTEVVVGAQDGAQSNEWNRLEVVCRGTTVDATLNGVPLRHAEGALPVGTFSLRTENGGEARVRTVAWFDGKGERVLFDNYAGSGHLQEVFFETKVVDKTLVVGEQALIHPGTLPKNCPRFRKTFACDREVVSAIASVSARGFHELWINGEAADRRRTLVGARLSGKVWMFETYDVTRFVKRGGNTIGLWLAPGYSDDFSRYGERWLKPKQALARLDICYADGSREAVVTDGTWEFAERSPVVQTSIYHGEKIDNGLADPAWCRPDGSQADWRPVQVVGSSIAAGTGGVKLRSNDMPPIRRWDPRHPVRITEPKPGLFVADFGQNRAGVVEARVKGPKGTCVRLRASELVDRAGMIDRWTLGEARSADEFVLAGTGEVESFLPRFTYHGFQFVEISGWPGRPKPEDLTGWAVGADLEETSSFSCSNAGLEWLHTAAYWSMRSNLMSYPTDCCQRHERNNCLMDSECYEDAACQFFDMRRFYGRFLECVGAGGPNPDWFGQPTMLARRLWRFYGDKRVLAERYPFMKDVCERMFAQSEDGVWTKGYGDWCAPNDGTWEGFFNDVGVVNTALFADMLESTAEAASVVGRRDEADAWRRKHARLRESFERRFRNKGTATYGDGSQTTAVMPLAFGLVPEQDRPLVFKTLVERIRTTDKSRLDTGGYGTRYIGDVLVEAGEEDLLVELFTQKECPGFGYMAAQGATTLWEQWPFKCMMDTHNHAFRSGAASCLYTHIAGIRPTKPGYAEIVVRPVFPSQVESLEAVRMTPRGRVKVAWKKSGASVRLNVTAPPFTLSRLALPGGAAAGLRPGETNSFDLDITDKANVRLTATPSATP